VPNAVETASITTVHQLHSKSLKNKFISITDGASVNTGAKSCLTVSSRKCEILSLKNIEFLRQFTLSSLVRFLASSDEYTNVATAMARILAAEPRSTELKDL